MEPIFGDFQAFLDSGNALLSGQYISLYPLPLVVIFALFSLLPVPVLLAFVIGGSVVLLVVMFKRRALLWIFFTPVLQTFALGQLTLGWLWLLRHSTGWSLALLTLKPQLAILALPLLIRKRELWRPFVLWMAVIYVPVTLIRPAWPIEWISQLNGDGRLGGTSSSLWPVPFLALAFVALALWVYRRGGAAWLPFATVLNPAIRAYDFGLFSGLSLWLIPLSWLAAGTMWLTNAAWPMAIVGVGAMLLGAREKENGDKSL